MGQITKGTRFAVTCRVPTYAQDHLRAQAAALQVPLGEYLTYRVLLVEGMDISTDSLRVVPQLIRMYPPERWEGVISAQPPDVVARIRRALAEPLELQEEIAMAG